MAARSLFIVTLLFGAAWAGCIGPKDAPVDTNVTNETDFNKANPLGGSTLVAFEETNKTEEGVGGVDHHHDMWNGQTRIEIFSERSAMAPYDRVDGVEYQAVAEFTPPDGTMVYEATATVEFSISEPSRHACAGRARLNGYWICTDTGDDIIGAPEVPAQSDPTGGPSGLKLRYKHASTTNWIDAGEIAWDVPLIIKITDPTQTDMPHSTSSGWAFQIASPHKEDSTLVFTAKATIVRGVGDVPLWPGHPDFYADSCCRRVLDVPDAVACDGSACNLVQSSGLITPDKLISYGTRTLHVWANITSVFAPNPALAPDVWFVRHINSTGRDNVTTIFDKEEHGAAIMEHYWILPVDDNGMDSPYADGSKWTFGLGGAFFKEGISCYGGCADWSAEYSLVVIATNEVLDPELYHMSCIIDTDCPPEEEEEGDAVRRD